MGVAPASAWIWVRRLAPVPIPHTGPVIRAVAGERQRSGTRAQVGSTPHAHSSADGGPPAPGVSGSAKIVYLTVRNIQTVAL